MLNVSLDPQLIGLDEVVVVGYGTQKKVTLRCCGLCLERQDKQWSGNGCYSISSGAVAGLNITPTQAGANPKVALYYYRAGTQSARATTPDCTRWSYFLWKLVDINPKDIESIEVLKDACQCYLRFKSFKWSNPDSNRKGCERETYHSL